MTGLGKDGSLNGYPRRLLLPLDEQVAALKAGGSRLKREVTGCGRVFAEAAPVSPGAVRLGFADGVELYRDANSGRFAPGPFLQRLVEPTVKEVVALALDERFEITHAPLVTPDPEEMYWGDPEREDKWGSYTDFLAWWKEQPKQKEPTLREQRLAWERLDQREFFDKLAAGGLVANSESFRHGGQGESGLSEETARGFQDLEGLVRDLTAVTADTRFTASDDDARPSVKAWATLAEPVAGLWLADDVTRQIASDKLPGVIVKVIAKAQRGVLGMLRVDVLKDLPGSEGLVD